VKKQTVSSLKKRADAAFSLYIRYRDGEHRPGGWYVECITCHQWKPLKEMQCGHFQRRSYNAVRYDEENCNAQCYVCNVMRYGEQYKYAQEVDLKYGDGTAKRLAKEAQKFHKLTIPELEEIIHDSKTAVAFYLKEG
jgi:hypothetical protein